MALIRPLVEADWPQVHDLVVEVATTGETHDMHVPEAVAQTRSLWEADHVAVAVQGDTVLGTARAGAHRPGRGSHVGTGSLVVAARSRGTGVGRQLAEHVIAWHRARGARAIHVDGVVSTNLVAVRLSRALGFKVVGVGPGAFVRPSGEYADLLAMHLDLTRPLTPAAAEDATVRERVVLTAARCFSEQGWRGTTVAGIAREAGVPVLEVERLFATKAELLMTALRRVSFGEHADVHAAFAALGFEAIDDVEGRLDAASQFAAQVLEPMAALAPALAEAAACDDAGSAVRLGLNLRRMSISHDLVRLLRRGAEPEPDAVAVVQMLTSAETYLTLRQMGWSTERFARWMRLQLDLAVNGAEAVRPARAEPR